MVFGQCAGPSEADKAQARSTRSGYPSPRRSRFESPSVRRYQKCDGGAGPDETTARHGGCSTSATRPAARSRRCREFLNRSYDGTHVFRAAERGERSRDYDRPRAQARAAVAVAAAAALLVRPVAAAAVAVARVLPSRRRGLSRSPPPRSPLRSPPRSPPPLRAPPPSPRARPSRQRRVAAGTARRGGADRRV